MEEDFTKELLLSFVYPKRSMVRVKIYEIIYMNEEWSWETLSMTISEMKSIFL